MTQHKFGIAQPARRKEDAALLRGAGRYVADYTPPGTLHAVVVRSPHAHAKFRITDANGARKMPGVRLVLTAADTADLGPLPCLASPPEQEIAAPPYPVLARDEVRHVGDAVAFIVADTLAEAKDAAEAIGVEWDALPAIVEMEKAIEEDAPQVWNDRPGNIAFTVELGDKTGTEAAFAQAARVIELKIVNQRLVTNYLDTRAVVAEYAPEADKLTLTLGSQGAHIVRNALCDFVLKIPHENMRVITPDVGGGFGTKLFTYREYALAAVAARALQRPVKWVADRNEHFLGDAQGRDNITMARLAVDDKGKFLALAVDMLCDMGAYLSQFAPYIPYVGAVMLPGVYDIPACAIGIRAVHTHTVPVDAYRGAGRPEAAYLIERLVDAAARDLGIAPDALRKRNFIKPRQMPYETPTHKVYDSGEFAAHMERAQEIADWDGFRHRHALSKKAKKLRGIGLSTYIEACGGNGPETAHVRLEGDGRVTVLIGSQSTGQGHHTAYAQLVSEHLDIPLDRITVIQGDTDAIATGMGTGGSSSIPCGGASVAGASRKLADNLKKLAADELEAAASDLEIAAGSVRVAGTDRAISFAALAAKANGAVGQTMLATEDAVEPVAPTYPNGTHVVEVEVDPELGTVDLVNYVVVDDFGVTLNPLMLEGQVHGGTVQGIGQALMENTVYDADSGQLLTASLMDYALPRAIDVPSFTFETRNVRCVTNVLGVKGAGEAGAIGSCPAVINAVVDALWRAYRVRHVDMPATPQRIWAAIENAKRLHTL
jgi:carbon-monoxide dehydrogenase large subunit